MLQVVGTDVQGLGLPSSINCQSVCYDILQKWHRSSWEALRNEDVAIRKWPDTERQGFKLAKYKAWNAYQFGRCIKSTAELKAQSHFTDIVQTCAEVRTLAAFRCGSTWLNCETQRNQYIGRSQRHCELCDRRDVEDEMHILFCEGYENVRQTFDIFSDHRFLNLRQLFDEKRFEVVFDDAVRSFYKDRQPMFWKQLCDYLLKIRHLRANGR